MFVDPPPETNLSPCGPQEDSRYAYQIVIDFWLLPFAHVLFPASCVFSLAAGFY